MRLLVQTLFNFTHEIFTICINLITCDAVYYDIGLRGDVAGRGCQWAVLAVGRVKGGSRGSRRRRFHVDVLGRAGDHLTHRVLIGN
jgi:hypothetical protein